MQKSQQALRSIFPGVCSEIQTVIRQLSEDGTTLWRHRTIILIQVERSRRLKRMMFLCYQSYSSPFFCLHWVHYTINSYFLRFADISSIFHHSILKRIQFYMMVVVNIYILMITTKVFLGRFSTCSRLGIYFCHLRTVSEWLSRNR